VGVRCVLVLGLVLVCPVALSGVVRCWVLVSGVLRCALVWLRRTSGNVAGCFFGGLAFSVNIGGIGVVVGVLAWVLVRLGLGWCPVRSLVAFVRPGRSYRTGWLRWWSGRWAVRPVRPVAWGSGAAAMFIFWLP